MDIADEAFYKQIGKIFCPYLDTHIVFNAKGIGHLTFKKFNSPRNEKDLRNRLKLMPIVVELLKRSQTLQGIDTGKKSERVRVHGVWQKRKIQVTFYAFIGIYGGYRVQIIVKKIGNGEPFFWSVIPYWRKGRQGKKLFNRGMDLD